jgi:hypothetical protein
VKSPFTSKYHPDSQALLSYAESLVDSQTLLRGEVFVHIQTCASCKAKVEDIRTSLSVVNKVEEIEPMGDLIACILLAAKQSPRTGKFGGWIRTGVLAACVFFVATIGLGYINQQQSVVQPEPTQETATLQKIELEAEAEKTIEEMTKRYEPVAQSTPVEKLVAPAVQASSVKYPMTDREREQMRALDFYGEDIDMALQALEHNPALKRAYDTIVTTQEVRDNTYLKVYMEDSR